MPEYGITVKELKALTDYRGIDAVNKIKEMGGLNIICKKLNTSPSTGVLETPAELKQRRKIFGSNSLPTADQKSFLKFILEAFSDFTIIMLAIAATLSLGLSFYTPHEGEVSSEKKEGWIDGFAILVTITVVVIVTAINNYSKEKQFRALQSKVDSELTFSVVRDKTAKEVPITDIVVGDICQIKYGDILPADGILIQSNDLNIDESVLTGESDQVKKSVSTDPVLFSGTYVMEGSGKVLVTAVGVHTKAGEIHALLNKKSTEKQKRRKSKVKRMDSKSEEGKTDEEEILSVHSIEIQKGKSLLQMKLTKLTIQLGYIGTAVAVLIIIILSVRFSVEMFIIQQKPWNNIYLNYFVDFLVIGVTVLVVALPEGLPLAVTISLAYSVKKMMKDNNLVRHLHACETMGNATVICTDKTGTLTTNRLTVVRSYICEHLYKQKIKFSEIPNPVGDLLVKGIAINCSYASRVIQTDTKKLPQHVGNKTDCALLSFVVKLGKDYQAIRNEYPEENFVKVYTFNSLRKYMGTIIRNDAGGFTIFVKGATEIILRKCKFIYDKNGKIVPLTTKRKQQLNKIIDTMNQNGLRTLSLAYRDFEEEQDWENEDAVVNDLTNLAIVGLEDPLRDEVPQSIRLCQNAGITVIMVTGDNVDTARSIATKCGIIGPKSSFLVLQSTDFNRMIRDNNGEFSQELFDEIWPKLRVLARSSPKDKYTLVKGIINSRVSKQREVVAVTGDGTNDAPALKIADVGFAMGIIGTDVAKAASDIIITDDNFSSIVKAVMWGRNVYDSVSKFLQFQLTVNFVTVTVAAVGAFHVVIPLVAVQILWINMIMDTLGSLALATEKPSPKLLRRKPYGRTKHLISPIMWKNIVGYGLYQLMITLLILFVGDKFLQVESGFKGGLKSEPTEHFTIVFNSFVMMTLFNEINARRINGERNVFEGILSNPTFYCIWIGTFAGQFLIVNFGGTVFSTKKLSLKQWMWCLLFGIGALPWAQLIISIPPRRLD